MNDANADKIMIFRSEYLKLGCSLADLHSAYNAGDLRQLDYDVMYHGYCCAMSRIKRSMFYLDPRCVGSL